MKLNLAALFCLGMIIAAAAYGQPAAALTKVGIIHFQNAMLGTKEGQKAAAELQAKFDPRSKGLEKQRNDILGLKDQFQKLTNTASEEVRQKYARDIDQKTKALQRDTEDAQAEFDQEQQRLLNDIGQKLLAVLNKYSRDNGYALVLDVSSPQTGVMFAAESNDITQEIVVLYDKNAPAVAAPPAPAGAKPGMTAPPPATGGAKPPAGGAKPAAPAKKP